jgi:glycosyltransferase involved in cell wall biosynthesis
MRIAYYSHYFTPEIGAPSARIYDLSREWLKAGHRAEVVTCFPNHPVGRIYKGYRAGLYMHELLDGIDVHRHWTYITPNKGFLKKTLGHVSFLPSALLFSNRRLSAPDVTIGSSPTFFAAMGAAGAGMQYSVPFVMEIRDLWPAIFVDLGVLRNKRAIRWLEKLELCLYRRATRVVTVTEAFRRNLISRGVPEEKVHTIPNGADTEYWSPCDPSADLRQELGLEGCFVVLYIGAHGISHALNRVLDSAARLAGHEEIRFLFVGEGAEKEGLVKRAEELRLKNVIFHDPVDKRGVKRFYALADACLVPLRDIPLFDSFIPSKMFEIMAMARPIIGSVSGEPAEILKRSGAAIVVPPEDSEAIADAVLRLRREPGEARAMGGRGRAFVVDHYSRRSLGATYAGFLQEAVDAYRRNAGRMGKS